ncbi:MAG: TM0106 family RecB-like putative nuclease, partial [Caulobacteraceae bacterium]
FDLRQTRHIAARLARDFERFAQEETRQTRAVKTAACQACAYAPRCEAEWRGADSPVFVAGISSHQVVRLHEAGVTTLAGLAECDPAQPKGGIGAESFARLVAQARLQLHHRDRGEHRIELLRIEPQRGFALLPPPAPGDLYFDIEGDPLYPEGLDYLFGLFGPLGPGGVERFRPFWGHDHAAEKTAFEALMRLILDHLARFERAHIFHYAAYETTALKRLAMRYASFEQELDDLLRGHRFVDLYRVARQALRCSTEGYSLKDLEKIYGPPREGEVVSAADSIVQYELWREVGESHILEAIERYNEEDCRSTARLRDWLESLRPAGASFGLADIPADPDEGSLERAREREEREAARRALAEAIRASGAGDESVRDLLAELLWFHQRAHKPLWWQRFDRQTWTDEELVEDMESLGGLERVDQRLDKRSFEATYDFPPQDTRLKEGSTPSIASDLKAAGTIRSLDLDEGRLVLRRGTGQGDFPPVCSLAPGPPIRQKQLIEGVRNLVSGLCEDPKGQPALMDFLLRRPPRLAGRPAGAPILRDGEDLVEGVTAAARDLDRSCLLVQGPPGTGKTYTTARAIAALLSDGRRVGVASNSHKAINELLRSIEAAAAERHLRFEGVKKASRGDHESVFDGANISSVFESGAVPRTAQLVAGTAFHFAGDATGGYDFLVIDEAGQVSLGNLAAMAGCAQNLIVVGDQMQLPQPVQGVHPGESGLSCMDYAMMGHATAPPERGILLNVSRRMHPSICGFISEAIYDGRLSAHPTTANQRLLIEGAVHPAIKPFGLSVIELEHEGRTQVCEEEAEVVEGLIGELLGQKVRGVPHVAELTLENILVVTPFNAQVALLKRRLPQGARVGTVDKFQGQEAPVVIISMATSFGGDAPRGTEFLFNRNRLNVAVSRAQCLAILVHGTRLLDLPQARLEDLPRLDLIEWFRQAAA